MMPAVSCAHVRGRRPVASNIRGIRLPLVAHSLGRRPPGAKSWRRLCTVTMLRRVAKYYQYSLLGWWCK